MRTSKLKLTTADIPQHVDVVFAPGSSPSGKIECGWIEFSANEQGRDAVRRIFPKAVFQWRECPYGWAGWQSIAPHVPSLVATVPNTVPLAITKGKPLREASDNALSFFDGRVSSSQRLTCRMVRRHVQQERQATPAFQYLRDFHSRRKQRAEHAIGSAVQ
jgi:hypothetical protein